MTIQIRGVPINVSEINADFQMGALDPLEPLTFDSCATACKEAHYMAQFNEVQYMIMAMAIVGLQLSIAKSAHKHAMKTNNPKHMKLAMFLYNSPKWLLWGGALSLMWFF